MEAKLTLSMNSEVIKNAKDFAKKNHTSLSQLVEDYFTNLSQKGKTNKDQAISPLVKSLSGVLHTPANFDYKKDRTDYLEKKHK